jgi:hypothetical protein
MQRLQPVERRQGVIHAPEMALCDRGDQQKITVFRKSLKQFQRPEQDLGVLAVRLQATQPDDIRFDHRTPSPRNKSLFASFSSEKEDSSFFEKKKQKNFYSWCSV